MTRDVRDPRLPFTGGSDRWDRGPAGEIVTDEFFGIEAEPPGGGGLLSVWIAGAWALKPVRVRIGGAWIVKPARRWSGSAWVLT
ncbi:hypothetical protein KBZ18_11110 [Synechococcus sp. Cruz-9H2]|uniref:hypothetical protein n=1 Tax=unclassified Synechococcus TaxID=2626047 RepID=UPI0020CBA632|nr:MULTISPECIES: hypothetical protein [unclassified Synechococcus]MCP9820038.1 hypothetical protein [Synechococcus sp. Cruz-9H2]MCP9844344.1 hypothetical protein [Synechococcus sp. Edmonson 11F2]MCP9856468.1 hypothetical protein [Synechococcus sp. Cruz-9C9]MCP9863757.1 hypothetical protein [Synechococcus sp. Cruz-7E5]MCP9870948.1 hypothetical protein [Synechococcus sp. Cruz-7B9]